MKKAVSIIVPAYNEEKRIGRFLQDLLKFAKTKLKNYEIILVDDGSTDNTLDAIKSITKKDKNAKIISYKQNRGKGYAVKQGIFASQGRLIVFIDADGSISPDQISDMLGNLKRHDVVVGNRASKESIVRQAKSRKIIGIIFNFYVSILFQSRVRDNLCGFKGFKKEAARALFKDLVAEKWLFDVELFHKIKKRHYSLYSMPLRWQHKGGSKIRAIDPFKMLYQLIGLRIKLMGKN